VVGGKGARDRHRDPEVGGFGPIRHARRRCAAPSRGR
jgi:hypothetical protein